MHSVPPQPAPAYLAAFKRAHHDQTTGQFRWNLSPNEHSVLIADLASQFGAPRRPSIGESAKPDPGEGICAYCERSCSKIPGSPTTNEIDHFYPRSDWNALVFEWTNLMYVCRRCNDAKDDGAFVSNLKSDPDSYVNPRAPQAENYFAFQVTETDCRMIPNENLQSKADIEKAQRTIRDLGLDRVDTIRNRNVRLLRANYLRQIAYVLSKIPQGKRENLLRRLSDRNCEFSSTVIWARACLHSVSTL